MTDGLGAPSPRFRPPRRPLRRDGSSPLIAFQPASAPGALARTAASSVQSSGLRRLRRSVSLSRSSGVRARRVIRCRSSAYLRRIRAASPAPSTRASTESSRVSADFCDSFAGPDFCSDRSGDLDSARSEDGPGPRSPRNRRSSFRSASNRFRCCCGGCGCRSLPFSARATVASRVSTCQSKLRSGCVCSSASITSASSALRPSFTLAGERNR